MHEYTFAQAGDVMFICHPLFMPRQLVRTSLTTFQVEVFAFDVKSDSKLIYQPYFSFQSLGVTLDPSKTSGTGATLTLVLLTLTLQELNLVVIMLALYTLGLLLGIITQK